MLRSSLVALLLLLHAGGAQAETRERDAAEPEPAPDGLGALLDAHCGDAPASEARAVLVRALDALPGYRTLDEADAPALDARDWQDAARHDAAFGAAALWAAWALPAFELPAEAPEGCMAAEVSLLVSVARDPAGAPMPAFRALLDTTALPPSFVRHLASALYLHEVGVGLEALADAAGPDAPLVQALAESLSGEHERARGELSTVLGRASDGVDAWAAWVSAEVLRRGGDRELALESVERALGADPFFAPALLTRAAIRVADGAEDLALADVQHLRLGFGYGSAYERWIRALERRVR